MRYFKMLTAPPRSNSQYQSPNTITFVSQIAPPVRSSWVGSWMPSRADEIDDQSAAGGRVRQAHDGDQRQARDPQQPCSALDPRRLGDEDADEQECSESGEYPSGMVRNSSGERQHEPNRRENRDGHLDSWFFARDTSPRGLNRSFGYAHRVSRVDQSLEPSQQLLHVVADAG